MELHEKCVEEEDTSAKASGQHRRRGRKPAPVERHEDDKDELDCDEMDQDDDMMDDQPLAEEQASDDGESSEEAEEVVITPVPRSKRSRKARVVLVEEDQE